MSKELGRTLATAAELASTMRDTNQPQGRRDYAKILLVRWIEDHAWMFAEAAAIIAKHKESGK